MDFDPALIQAAQRGEPAAIETLLREIAPSIQRFAERMCGNHESEDAAQEALILIARHLPQFEGRSSLTSWAFPLVRTSCLRRRRGAKNAPSEPLEKALSTAAEGPSPEGEASSRELTAMMENALAALPEELREVVLLRDLEGLEAPEAAEALGLSVAALKSRLHRARAKLKDLLAQPLGATSAKPVACPDAISLLSQRIEGELDAATCEEMDRHLTGCAFCGAACEALRRVLRAASSLKGEGPLPPKMQARVKRAVEALVAAQPAPRHVH